MVDTGSYSPLLGQSFTEIAAKSRSMHKSQGFGATGSRGSNPNLFEHRKGDEATEDLFDGIDTTWTRVQGGGAVGAALAAVAERFDAANPAASVPALLEARALLGDLEEESPWVAFKRVELDRVIQAACGLWLEVTADQPSAAPGEAVELRARVINRSDVPLTLASVELPFESGVRAVGQALAFNETWELDIDARVPSSAPSTPPYWLSEPPEGALYAVADASLIGRPEHHPNTVRFLVEAGDQELTFEQPLLHRFTERVEGERYRPFAVLPRVSVEVEGAVHVFADEATRPVRVSLRAGQSDVDGSVRLRMPTGWSASPESQTFELAAGGSTSVVFEVTPTSAPSSGDLVAEAHINGRDESYSAGVQVVDYRHIPVQTMIVPASARVVRLDLERRGENIGYVEGAGDEVPEALRQIGYEVSMISDDELASGDLGGYDAIVVGIRAYNARPAVSEHNRRLLDYVEAGGTLVVQYNTSSRRGTRVGARARRSLRRGHRGTSHGDRLTRSQRGALVEIDGVSRGRSHRARSRVDRIGRGCPCTRREGENAQRHRQ